MNYQHVVLALDGSIDDTQIVETLKKADATADKVTLLTVVETSSNAYCNLDFVSPELVNFEVQAEENVKSRLEALVSEQGLNAKVAVRVGIPAFEINGFAENNGADLILMGSHRRQGLGRLLGSTARAVLRDAPCDVHVVRIDASNADNNAPLAA